MRKLQYEASWPVSYDGEFLGYYSGALADVVGFFRLIGICGISFDNYDRLQSGIRVPLLPLPPNVYDYTVGFQATDVILKFLSTMESVSETDDHIVTLTPTEQSGRFILDFKFKGNHIADLKRSMWGDAIARAQRKCFRTTEKEGTIEENRHDKETGKA